MESPKHRGSLVANSKLVKFRDKKGNSYPHLFIDSMTGIFYAIVRANNKTKKRSLETSDFNTARSLILEKASEILKEVEPSKKQNLIFKDYYDKMIKEKEASDTSASTLERIDTIWRLSIEPFWAYQLPEDINQDLVTEFMTWHRRKRPGVQFINVFKYLGNVFNVMVRSGALLPVNVPELEVPKDEAKHHAKQKGRYIQDAEIISLIKYAVRRTDLMILLAFCTGMRKMEIGSLELSRLKLRDGRYTIILDTDDTKTGLAREIPVPAILTQRLDEIVATKGKYLFPLKSDPNKHMSSQVIDKGWTDAKKLSGVKARFHDLRHTCATNLAKSNINPVIAVTMLGMSLVTYQKRYLKLTSKDLIIACEANADRLLQALQPKSDHHD